MFNQETQNVDLSQATDYKCEDEKCGTDTFTIKLNGETATNKSIIIEALNLPFTIEGLLITSLVITVPDGDTTASDSLSILSFH